MKHQKLTEAEERRLGETIAAEARAMGFTGKEKKCRRKQSAASRHGNSKPFPMNERQPENGTPPRPKDGSRKTPSPGSHNAAGEAIYITSVVRYATYEKARMAGFSRRLHVDGRWWPQE